MIEDLRGVFDANTEGGIQKKCEKKSLINALK
jgi:hypothetical protein